MISVEADQHPSRLLLIFEKATKSGEAGLKDRQLTVGIRASLYTTSDRPHESNEKTVMQPRSVALNPCHHFFINIVGPAQL